MSGEREIMDNDSYYFYLLSSRLAHTEDRTTQAILPGLLRVLVLPFDHGVLFAAAVVVSKVKKQNKLAIDYTAVIHNISTKTTRSNTQAVVPG